jgi:hypothetical protein
MVVEDPAVAAALVAAGSRVVLMIDPDSPDQDSPRTVWPEGPGRLAVFLGRPDDPAARSAAAEMAKELFGSANS